MSDAAAAEPDGGAPSEPRGTDAAADSPEAAALDAPQGATLARAKVARVATPDTKDVAALGQGNRRFAFELLQKLTSADATQNLVLSPYSISDALAMLYAGARGTTEAQMKSVLHFDLSQSALHAAFNATEQALASRGQGGAGADGTPFRLNVGNSIWLQKEFPVQDAYLDVLARNYGAGVYQVDFEAHAEPARVAINAWIDDRTEHLIPELLHMGDITRDTRFVLTNTVYMNAGWAHRFIAEATKPAPFHKLNGNVDVDTMHASFYASYVDADNYQAVELPYVGNALRMLAIMPDAGAYAAVEKGMTQAFFDEVRAKLATKYVALAMPKLDFGARFKLGETLKSMGLDWGSSDFTGITAQAVKISDVIHEAKLRVFEAGTVAAAATAIIGVGTSLPPTPIAVNFDRPYLFAVYDEPTGEVLFVGRVLDPSAK